MDLDRPTGVYGLFAYLLALSRFFFRPIEQALKTTALLARLAALEERTRAAEARASDVAANFERETERQRRKQRALTSYLDATLREVAALRTAHASRETLAAAQTARLHRLEATVRRFVLAEERARRPAPKSPPPRPPPCQTALPPRRQAALQVGPERDSVHVFLITRLHTVLQTLMHLSRKAHVSAADVTGLLFDVRDAGRIGRCGLGSLVPTAGDKTRFSVCLAPGDRGALSERSYIESSRAAFGQSEERVLSELARLLDQGSTRGTDMHAAEKHVRGMSVLAFQAAWIARLHKELFFPTAQAAG